jgi:hypothetical protein
MSLAVSTSMYGENERTKTSINDTINCLWACKHLALSTHVEKTRVGRMGKCNKLLCALDGG